MGAVGPLLSDDWDRDLHPMIREFRKVQTLEDYLEVRSRLWMRVWIAQSPRVPTRATPTAPAITVVNVNNSSVAQLNVAETVRNLNSRINALSEAQPRVAQGLEELREAATSAAELDERQRARLLENLDDLAEQAEHPPERRKEGRLAAALEAVEQAAGLATSIGEAWQEWGSVIGDSLLP